MGTKDIAEKSLLSYNDVFADIVNVLACGGKQEIREEDLSDAQAFSQYKAIDGELREQERDIAKFWNKNEVHLSLIGLENQTVQDNAMPLRVIGYDGAAYREQIHNKKSSWYPVITLVLYFGTDSRWTMPKSLSEQIAVPHALKPLFNDYKANIYDVAWLSDDEIQSFQSDFRLVAQYLKALRTGQVEDWNAQKLKHVHEIMTLFQVISNDDIYSEMEDFVYETQRVKGGTKVIDIFRQNYNKGISIGRNEGISIGRNEGISIGRNEGISIGRNEGISIGRNEGISSLTAVMSRLFAEGRDADVKRAMSDSTYLQELLSQYKD